jgi:hypothetical protein
MLLNQSPVPARGCGDAMLDVMGYSEQENSVHLDTFSIEAGHRGPEEKA